MSRSRLLAVAVTAPLLAAACGSDTITPSGGADTEASGDLSLPGTVDQ